MRVELTEVQWLDAQHELSLGEFLQLSGLPETELRQLVDYGVITPLNPAATSWTFGANYVPAARTACRLRRDFDLDIQGLTVAMTLIDRVHELENRILQLSAQLPHRIR
ncbi:MAG: chaperone modulator CbpM [Gammaproteobacteria bacterium]